MLLDDAGAGGRPLSGAQPHVADPMRDLHVGGMGRSPDRQCGGDCRPDSRLRVMDGDRAASVVLVVVGLLRRASRPALTTQSLAMLGYGGVAMIALVLVPVAGAVLASLSLIAHAVWDLIHYRRNAVVPRSLAEFCMFFDVPLGAAVVVLVLTS